MITSAQTPSFQESLTSGIYGLGQSIPALNGTATVSDGGTITYQWQYSTNGSSWYNLSGQTGPTYTPPSNTIGTRYYRVIATNTNGYPNGLTPSNTLYPANDLYPVDVNTMYTAQAQSNVATIQIAEAENPVFSSPLVSNAYNMGDPASPLDGTATAPNGTISYQWQYSTDLQSWSDLTGETNSTYTPPTTAAGVTHYRVIATNTVGSTQKSATSTTSSIEIFGAQAPVFTAPLQSADYDSGAAAAALNGAATAPHGTISYQWYADGQAISGATNATYTPPTTTVGVRQYYVTVTNSVGLNTASAQSNTVSITVYGATAPVFSGTLSGAAYNYGDAAEPLDGTATAPRGTVTYQWYANGTAISGATQAVYTPTTNAAGSVSYQVTATNTVGNTIASATLGPVTITVYDASGMTFVEVLSGAEYNYGDTASALNGTAVAPHGTISYQWYADGSPISGATGAKYTPPTNVGGSVSYTVTATNTVGTSQQTATLGPAVITVYEAQTPSFTETLSRAVYDFGDAATPLNGTATAPHGTVSYQWYLNGEAIAGETEATYTPPTNQAGTFSYSVTAINTVGTSQKSNTAGPVTITVYEAETPAFQGTISGAEYDFGDSAISLNGTATAQHGTILYQWYANESPIEGATSAVFTPPTDQEGTVSYSVTATNVVGTSQKTNTLGPVEITVYAAHPPAFSGELNSAEYDIGNPAAPLNGTATVSRGSISYQWYADGNPIQGATGPTYTPPTTAAGSVLYSVTATNTVGTSQESATLGPVTITVYAAETPVFKNTLQDAEYNIGDPASALNGTATATHGTVTYQWYADGSPISGATNPTYTPPTDSAGTVSYSVTATNIVGTSQESATLGPASVTVYAAVAPTFLNTLQSAEYDAGDSALTLNGAATAPRGPITYQWYANGTAISGATSASYTPPTTLPGTTSYYVVATNIVGTSQESSQSNTATIIVYGATVPVFTVSPVGADYVQNDIPTALTAQATAVRGTVTIYWQVLNGNTWTNIPGASGNSYTPPTNTAGTYQYRAVAVNTVGTDTAENYSAAATITVKAAETPVFSAPLISGSYNYAAPAAPLNGTATVSDGGTITYQWYKKGPNDEGFFEIQGAVSATYTPKTIQIGQFSYYVIATNTLRNSSSSAQSTTAMITVLETRATASEKWEMYLNEIRQPFQKLVRLDFLQPDGSVAFSLDNNPRNKRSGAFIQDGSLDVNLQNGQRRKATVLLSNLNSDYEFAINKIWFGQQIRLMEGILLSNGESFYLPQGVFYVSDPEEAFQPNQKYVQYNLLDKWAYLDGTLFGNLEGIYEVPLNTNILTVISSILALDRGNGYVVDNVPPIFSDYWNGKTVTLESGETISVLLTPYTYRCDSGGGCYADILLEMNTMLVGWIGYDQSGHLRLDAGDDDILDTEKPVLWTFSPQGKNFLGATYSPKITQVYNDIIIVGQALDDNPTPMGRATNMDPRSDTNIYSSLGRRTLRKDATAYYATEQCQDYAAYTLKRNTIIKKSVTISSSQMFHLTENSLVQVRRPDKQGAPTERHLVTGFSRRLAGTENMTINCTSVQDFPEATLTSLPGDEN